MKWTKLYSSLNILGHCPSLRPEWNWSFPILWPLLSFPNSLAYWVQHFNSITLRILNSSAGIPSPPLALFLIMFPKAHLTSHSRMSSSRWVWVITPSWLSGSWRSFLYSSSVYSCHLFLISSASVRSRPFLSFFVQFCMKYSLDISNFLEEISSLSYFIVFLYFFALISEEGFLISSCYSLELCIQMSIFPFLFCLLLLFLS